MQLQPWPARCVLPTLALTSTALLQCHPGASSGSHSPLVISPFVRDTILAGKAAEQRAVQDPGSQSVNYCVSPSSCHRHSSQQSTINFIPKTFKHCCSLSFLAMFSNQVLIVLRIQLISQAFHSITHFSLSPSLDGLQLCTIQNEKLIFIQQAREHGERWINVWIKLFSLPVEPDKLWIAVIDVRQLLPTQENPLTNRQ